MLTRSIPSKDHRRGAARHHGACLRLLVGCLALLTLYGLVALYVQSGAAARRQSGASTAQRPDRSTADGPAAAAPFGEPPGAANARMHAERRSSSAETNKTAPRRRRRREALLWRPLQHIRPTYRTVYDPVLRTPRGLPVAYLVSAFLDTRPLMYPAAAGLGPQIVLIMAANVHTAPRQLQARLVVGNNVTSDDAAATDSPAAAAAAGAAAPSVHNVPVSFSFVHQFLGRWGPWRYTFGAGAYIGDVPAGLSLADLAAGQRPLRVTLVRSAADADPPPEAWSQTIRVLPIIRSPRNTPPPPPQSATAPPAATPSPHPFLELPPPLAAPLTADDYARGRGAVAMCCSPLYGNRYASSLLHWTELVRLMGASAFYLYVLNGTGVEAWAEPTLRHYEAAGLYKVIHMAIPSGVSGAGVFDSNAHSVVAQDCLYRTMGRYRWAAFFDMDEAIVPRAGPPLRTWRDVVQHAADQHLPATGGPAPRPGMESEWPPPHAFRVGYCFRNRHVCPLCRNHLVTEQPFFPGASAPRQSQPQANRTGSSASSAEATSSAGPLRAFMAELAGIRWSDPIGPQVKTLAMLMVNLVRPRGAPAAAAAEGEQGVGGAGGMRVDVAPNARAAAALAAVLGDGTITAVAHEEDDGDGGDGVAVTAAGRVGADTSSSNGGGSGGGGRSRGRRRSNCFLSRVPSMVWGATVEEQFTSDGRCRRKSKCLVDPLALTFMAAHYPAAAPAWNEGSRPGGAVRIPWHHDNYACLPPELGAVYHARSDVHRLNTAAVEEACGCLPLRQDDGVGNSSNSYSRGSSSSRNAIDSHSDSISRSAGASTNGTRASASSLFGSCSAGSSSSSSSAARVADGMRSRSRLAAEGGAAAGGGGGAGAGRPDTDSSSSRVTGLLTPCRACYFGEPVVDFTVANLYGAEWVERVGCVLYEMGFEEAAAAAPGQAAKCRATGT